MDGQVPWIGVVYGGAHQVKAFSIPQEKEENTRSLPLPHQKGAQIAPKNQKKQEKKQPQPCFALLWERWGGGTCGWGAWEVGGLLEEECSGDKYEECGVWFREQSAVIWGDMDVRSFKEVQRELT